MRRSLPIQRTTTSPELSPTRICTSTPCARRSPSDLLRALDAELAPRGQLGSAVRARKRQRRRALQAELRLRRILLLASWTLHSRASSELGRASRHPTIACAWRRRQLAHVSLLKPKTFSIFVGQQNGGRRIHVWSLEEIARLAE